MFCYKAVLLSLSRLESTWTSRSGQASTSQTSSLGLDGGDERVRRREGDWWRGRVNMAASLEYAFFAWFGSWKVPSRALRTEAHLSYLHPHCILRSKKKKTQTMINILNGFIALDIPFLYQSGTRSMLCVFQLFPIFPQPCRRLRLPGHENPYTSKSAYDALWSPSPFGPLCWYLILQSISKPGQLSVNFGKILSRIDIS